MRGRACSRWSLAIVITAASAAAGCESVIEPKSLIQSIDLFVGSGNQALGMDRGSSITLTVEARDSSGHTVQVNPAVTFASRNPGVVVVSDAGIATGVNAGTTYVVATMKPDYGPALTDSLSITVVAPRGASALNRRRAPGA